MSKSNSPFWEKPKINDNYIKVDDGRFFGLLKKGRGLESHLKDVINSKEYHWHPQSKIYQGDSDKYFVKRLRRDELTEMPPKRFVNSVILSLLRQRSFNIDTINPIGLIFEGRPLDLLVDSSSNQCYFISNYIEGREFLKIIDKQELTEEETNFIFRRIRLNLGNLRENNLYLLDFAPRDIIITENNYPILLDTEHLEFVNEFDKNKSEEILLSKQRKQFREDYSLFLDEEQLKKAEEMVFGQ